jgi:hypothetical protein
MGREYSTHGQKNAHRIFVGKLGETLQEDVDAGGGEGM